MGRGGRAVSSRELASGRPSGASVNICGIFLGVPRISGCICLGECQLPPEFIEPCSGNRQAFFMPVVLDMTGRREVGQQNRSDVQDVRRAP